MTVLLATPGIGRTSRAFRVGLVALGERLSIDPNFIASVMAAESGFDPSARNPRGGATGLIQFMPSTAKILGTTTDALGRMSDAEQLPFVERFYLTHARKIHSPAQAYMATFLPEFASKPDGFVLGEKGSREILYGSTTKGKIYELNPFDRTGKGFFTVGDVGQVASAIYARAVASGPYIETGAADPKKAPPAPPASYSLVPLPSLRLGDCGPAVWVAQSRLLAGLDCDGKYGPRTQAAVRAAQAAAHLPVTGEVDDRTWGILVPWRAT